MQLEEIYSMIPDFKCKPHCHECCGPIIWSPIENKQIQAYMTLHGIKAVHWSIEQYKKNNWLCPYQQNDKCIIYPVRPLVCRLQGHIKKLPCPYSNPHDVSQQLLDNIYRKLNKMR